MQLGSLPIGGDGAVVSLSVSKGAVVVTVSVPAQGEVDALLKALEAKLPAALIPLVEMAKAAADAELAQA